MLQRYRIKDWAKHFETHESRKLKRLDWVAMPNKHDGLGFRLVAAEKDAPALMGAWTLIVQIASKSSPGARGILERDGRPLTSRDLHVMTGFPSKLFDRALAFFAQERVGWLVAEHWQTDLPGFADAPAESAGTPADGPRNLPGRPREDPDTGQDRTGHNNTGQDRGSGGPRAAVAAPANDAEWLASLKSNPAYQGIDIEREYGKMLAWCQTNNRQPNRRRFINWLNKCDRPMNPGAASRPAAKPLPEPTGWKTFLNHEYPESAFSANGDKEAHEWSDLPPDIQKWLIGEMRKKAQL